MKEKVFKAVVNDLITSDDRFEEKINQLKYLEDLLIRTIGNDIDKNTQPTDIILTKGIAINPELARNCFQDYFRTYSFMYGVYKCATEKLKQHSTKLNILYAGTGPYLTIILPLLFLLSNKEINITALEINEHSHFISKQLIKELKKESYFKLVSCCDALTYATADRFDIIISETMDKALSREPQVAIFSNLINYLKPNGHLIPEFIKVNLLASSVYLEKKVMPKWMHNSINQNYNHHRQFVDCILIANKPFYKMIKKTKSNQYWLKSIRTKDIKRNLNELLLITEINVYDDIFIKENESWITQKTICYSLTDECYGKNFDVFYVNDQNPRIELTPII